MMVIVTITNGKSVEHAKVPTPRFCQRRNVMDTRDPLIAVVHAIEARVSEANDPIAWQSRQVPSKGGFIAAASFVRTAVACFAQGIAGVQATKGEIPTRGYSFAGGAKDSGTVAFKALTDAADPNFARIRSIPHAPITAAA